MITLYHCRDARSFRALWALEEIGIAYELKAAAVPAALSRARISGDQPFGTVPLLTDGATRMTESAAIPQYLADRYAAPPFRVLPEEPDYGAYLNALHFGEATLTFPQTIVLRYGQLEPEERRCRRRSPITRNGRSGACADCETWLAGADYVAAGRFTAADISVAYALMLTKPVGLWDQAPSSLQDYFERVSSRPAFARAKTAQGGEGIF